MSDLRELRLLNLRSITLRRSFLLYSCQVPMLLSLLLCLAAFLMVFSPDGLVQVLLSIFAWYSCYAFWLLRSGAHFPMRFSLRYQNFLLMILCHIAIILPLSLIFGLMVAMVGVLMAPYVAYLTVASIKMLNHDYDSSEVGSNMMVSFFLPIMVWMVASLPVVVPAILFGLLIGKGWVWLCAVLAILSLLLIRPSRFFMFSKETGSDHSKFAMWYPGILLLVAVMIVISVNFVVFPFFAQKLLMSGFYMDVSRVFTVGLCCVLGYAAHLKGILQGFPIMVSDSYYPSN